MAEDRTLAIAVEAKLNRLDKNMSEAVKKIRDAAGKMEATAAKSAARMDSHFARFATATTKRFALLKTAIGGYLSFQGLKFLGSMVTDALEAAASIKDVANAADISTGALQELRFAATQNGASVEILDDALTKLNKNLGEFRTSGAGPAAEALKYLGLAQDVTANKFANSDEAFTAVLRKISEVPVAADRAALAADLFGKSAGPKMAEMLAAGEEGIRAAREEARRLGIVLTDEMIQKADDADDQLNALWLTLKTKGVEAIAANADEIKQFASYVLEAIPKVIQAFKELAYAMGLRDRSALEAIDMQIAEYSQLLDTAENSIFGGALNLNFGGGDAATGFYSPEDVRAKIADLKAYKEQLEGYARARDKAGAKGDAFMSWVDGKPSRTRYAGVDPDAAKSAKAAATETEKLEKASARAAKEARDLGKNLIEAFGEKAQEQLGLTTQKAEEAAQTLKGFKDSFRSDFVQSFKYAFESGDVLGAVQHLAESFADRALENLANSAFDAIWNAGVGDVLTEAFGNADVAAAQATLASSTSATASAMVPLTTNAHLAATALGRLAGMGAAQGGSSGGLGGLLAQGIGALFGGGGGAAGWSKITGMLGARALGGPVTAGTPYMVGERGPEPFVPAVNGRILSVQQAQQAMRSGGGPVFAPVINMPGADSAAVSRMAAELDAQRRQFQSWAASEGARVRGHVNQGIERRSIGRGA